MVESGLHIVQNIKHDNGDESDLSISSDLSTPDENYDTDDDVTSISDLSYDEDDDNDTLTTVTYMSDFSDFLHDDEDETLTTVSSNFTADLFDEDDISLSDYASDDFLDDFSEGEGGELEKAINFYNLNGHSTLEYTVQDIAHAILDEIITDAMSRSHL